MARCEWCNKNEDILVDYTDAIGKVRKICAKCKDTVDACECRKCGEITDPSMMINGLCTNCVQADLLERSKRREEVRLGVDTELLESMTSDVIFTEKDYETWLLMGSAFSPDDLKNSRQLKRLWILIKLNVAGLYEENEINKHIDDLEILLDRNLSKLINNKCRVLIGDTAEDRRELRNYEVIDYENSVYILRV